MVLSLFSIGPDVAMDSAPVALGVHNRGQSHGQGKFSNPDRPTPHRSTQGAGDNSDHLFSMVYSDKTLENSINNSHLNDQSGKIKVYLRPSTARRGQEGSRFPEYDSFPGI